jgi:hypothetical protein
MGVMHVREVRMLVLQPVMPMGMGMRLARRITGRVFVPVVLIVSQRLDSRSHKPLEPLTTKNCLTSG